MKRLPRKYRKITEEQMGEATRKLSNKKIPNQDIISNEVMISRETTVMEEYKKLFNIILHCAKYQRNGTVPMYKKGDKTDPANQTLLNTLLKLLTKVIPGKIISVMPISKEQQEFQRNRSTIDELFKLKQLVKKFFRKYMMTEYPIRLVTLLNMNHLIVNKMNLLRSLFYL